ncbi:MAG TPA: metal ABC transporter ATP-binding protein [Dehalococcoidia bacterium]|nr:metal ABC transporter ATP-binding protein [Dehalococcoidia bacterium]
MGGEPQYSLLSVSDVIAGYGSEFALSGIKFEARGGDLVGLVGPNGAGKSTLLKAIAGVLPSARRAITLDGRPLRKLASRVAFVPQSEDVNWDFPTTARNVVLMGRYRAVGWLRRPDEIDRAAADGALAELGLEGAGDRHISQFSGGQQQRIFLARALAQDPKVVLLDEPLTGIDTTHRSVVRSIIEHFRASGAIVLMATHDLDEVRESCSQSLFLNRRQVAFGPTEQTFTVSNLRAAFGGAVVVFS